MRSYGLAGILSAFLAAAAPVHGQYGLMMPPVSVVADPAGFADVSDRPTELPPLITPPSSQAPVGAHPAPARRPSGSPEDYDPSYLYLPERNPGTRQPPCPCLPLGRVWVISSYFLGTSRNDAVPALASGGGGTLFGGERLEHGFRSGMRLDAGAWLDHCQNWGVEGHFFFMESSLADFQARSAGDRLLTRPFLTPAGIRDDAILAAPDVGPGGIAVTAPLTFLSTEANGRRTLFCEDNRRLDLVVGYRFVRLAESLRIATAQSSVAGDATRLVEDQFRTENQFHGGQVGVTGEYRLGRWYADGTAAVAFGLTWERLDIDGGTRSTSPTGTQVTGGGLLALPSNSGRGREADFAVVPEANLTVGYQLADHWRAFLGYTFLYVSNVARPGQAIDPVVNLTQLPPSSLVGASRPQRKDAVTDFWVQGVKLGLEVRY
jgi:Putative beta barrel porin-7 (BBP7)